jgi:hypothetical protein
MEYVIVRTARAGVFAGFLKAKTGMEATLVNVRRIWYWAGAASLSQLAVKEPANQESVNFLLRCQK